MGAESEDEWLVATLTALPKKERTLQGMRATIARNLRVIYEASDKGYSYGEIADLLSAANPEKKVTRQTLKTYMGEHQRDLKLYPKMGAVKGSHKKKAVRVSKSTAKGTAANRSAKAVATVDTQDSLPNGSIETANAEEPKTQGTAASSDDFAGIRRLGRRK